MILVLLAAVAALATLAHRLRVPYPILLVLGGLVLGFVPGLPQVELKPELVFLLFLPPLLYVSALFTSWRDFRANLRAISLLAVGLVLMTTCVVAVVAHAAIEGLDWASAFVLGAIVSPTDAVAATAVAQRLGVPRRIVTVLEGESLVNDAMGIVAYRIAAVAVVTGAFSLWEASLQFVVGAVGGVVVGLAVGWVILWARRHVSEDPSVQNIISLLTPFVAYLPAEELPAYIQEELHFSGVLAVVAAGLYLGRRGPYVISPETRLQGYAVWELVTFLLNGLIFILIGLQLRSIVEGLSEYSVTTLVLYGGLISLTVILVRFVWVFPATYVPRWASRRLPRARPFSSVASRVHRGLGRDARCHLARGSPRTAADHQYRSPVSRKGSYSLPDFLRDPSDARGAGLEPAGPDPGAGARGRWEQRAGGDLGKDRGSSGCAGAHRGAGRGGVDARGYGRAVARALQLPPKQVRRALRRRRGRAGGPLCRLAAPDEGAAPGATHDPDPAAQRGPDRRRGHAPPRTRPRPRRVAAGDLRMAWPRSS